MIQLPSLVQLLVVGGPRVSHEHAEPLGDAAHDLVLPARALVVQAEHGLGALGQRRHAPGAGPRVLQGLKGVLAQELGRGEKGVEKALPGGRKNKSAI